MSSPHARLAESTRRLVDAVLAAHATDAELEAAADATDALASRLTEVRLPDAAPHERTHADYLPRSPFDGAIIPLAPPLEYQL